VSTDAFVLVHGVAPEIVRSVVPPACAPVVDARRDVDASREEVVLDGGEWSLRHPACHLLPSLSVLTQERFRFRFEVAVRVQGRWSAWVAAATIGREGFPALPPTPGVAMSPPLRSDVDVFTCEPADRVRVRVRLACDDVRTVLDAPSVMTLSAFDGKRPELEAVSGAARLDVPSCSQMEEPEPVRRRICSPTSVAMVLQRWGRKAEPLAVAADAFHAGLDLYGVWPAAIHAAARRGVAGYLLRFPDWSSAAWCLRRGLPVIASIRYSPGELDGAAMDETTGHLVVVTGYDGDAVYANDPAAPTRASVARRYAQAQFARAWLEHSGVGYVLFDINGGPRTGPPLS
jgi:hypothetical protein